MVGRVALIAWKMSTTLSRLKGTNEILHLIALQGRIVISIILGTNDTILWVIELKRMSRQIGKLVIRSGEEEGRVLARRDAGYPGDSKRFPSKRGRDRNMHREVS